MLIFRSLAGMSLNKLSLVGDNLINPDYRESLVSVIPAGDGKLVTLFYSVHVVLFDNLFWSRHFFNKLMFFTPYFCPFSQQAIAVVFIWY